MFFILIALNLVLYIASAFTFHKGNHKVALIYLACAIVLTLVSWIYYYRTRKLLLRKKEEGVDTSTDLCSVAFNGLDCFDGSDCLSVGHHAGHGLSGLDCGILDCGGLDCHV